MKILKIFGIVVGIHLFALILIFANPGCSTSSQPRPSPTDTVAPGEPGPTVSVPGQTTVNYGAAADSPFAPGAAASPLTAAPISFNPDATGVRFSPTRPNTPAASTLQAQPVADVMPASAYTVVKGDSLWSIAKSHHLTVGELAEANSLSANATLRLGQRLVVPGKSTVAPAVTASAAAEPPAPRAPAEAVTHTVKAGETLGAIARKYQVTVGEIATANNITDPGKIRPGRELIIPGWKSPGARASTQAGPQPAAQPAAAKPAVPLITLPAPEQDLDAGLKKTGEVPVIKVEESDPFGQP